MPRMTGGDAIVDSLLRHGIDTIFGLPGVQMYGLFDAFARNANRLKVLNARHEQTTAYMALGYAQSTGKPSAFTVVPGPGVMNTMGALTTAWGVNAPIMCITGQVPSAMIGRGRGQLHEMPDQLATLKTLLKFAERIEHPTEAPQVMARAFQAMMSGRPGPVAVEMPWDMFSATADVTPMEPLGKRDNPVPDPDKVAALAKLVDGAKAPMIWIGGGAVDAGPEILALAEKIGASVVSFRMGKGVVDSRHPLSLNTVGGFELWDKTDLLIGIGTRLDVPIARWAPAPAGLKTARIDIDPIEHRRLSVDVAIVADAADGTRALAALVKSKDDPARRVAVASAKAAALAAIEKADPQYSFMKVLREVLPDDGIVVDEVTQLGYMIWYGYPVHQPRRLISSGFSGTLGYGFPTALGVKVANPDRPVISVAGDGGFLFGGSDLATAKQFGINLVTVVVNNASYGNVLRDQQRLYEGRHSGSLLTNPDFQAYARSFGIAAWRVETADGLRDALREALASDAPALIEVMSDIAKDYPPYRFHQPRLRSTTRLMPLTRTKRSTSYKRLARAQLPLDTVSLAQSLIGKILVRETTEGLVSGRIVETEAYPVGDPAGHAYRGMTTRNRSLFLGPGHAYVYMIYGSSYMLNVASEIAGVGAGVLIRALAPMEGISIMERNRGSENPHQLTRGPGRVAHALQIDRRLDGIDLCRAGPLWLACDNQQQMDVGKSVRIGLSRGAELMLRFYLRGSRFVSGPSALNR